jgi:hypothetical protein
MQVHDQATQDWLDQQAQLLRRQADELVRELSKYRPVSCSQCVDRTGHRSQYAGTIIASYTLQQPRTAYTLLLASHGHRLWPGLLPGLRPLPAAQHD